MSTRPRETRQTLFREIVHYVRHYKRWWLIPMISVFVLFAALVIVAEVVPIVSPFIYTLF